MDDRTLVDDVLDGDVRALARTISRIENREPGYRSIISTLYGHSGSATVIGITGSPGAGKSTLVDKLTAAYRSRGLSVGVLAIDPSSPFSGGSVLGDRIRMADSSTDDQVFVRSMSARGSLGGLSSATAGAVRALDAFGKDVVLIETVGAGQNEIDIVRIAETVVVLVPPGAGDAVQTLKAGMFEIADIFVVNKADRDGADRTVRELREMLEVGSVTRSPSPRSTNEADQEIVSESTRSDTFTRPSATASSDGREEWSTRIIETVATSGAGVESLLDAIDAHRTHLDDEGERSHRVHRRSAEEIRTLLREDVNRIVESLINDRGGIDAITEPVATGESDPYTVADRLVAPIEACLEAIDRSNSDRNGENDPTPLDESPDR